MDLSSGSRRAWAVLAAAYIAAATSRFRHGGRSAPGRRPVDTRRARGPGASGPRTWPVRGRGRDSSRRIRHSAGHRRSTPRTRDRHVGTHVLATAIDTDGCWWQDQLGGPFPVSIEVRDDDRPPDLLAGVIESITATTIVDYGVPARTAWGNVASAAGTAAATMIARSRLDIGQSARDAADAILADPRVEYGSLRSGFGLPTDQLLSDLPRQRRHSAVCGDCVLLDSPRQGDGHDVGGDQ